MVTGEHEVLVDRVKDVVARVTGVNKVLVDRVVKDVVGEQFDVVGGGLGVSRGDDVCAEDLVGGARILSTNQENQGTSLETMGKPFCGNLKL